MRSCSWSLVAAVWFGGEFGSPVEARDVQQGGLGFHASFLVKTSFGLSRDSVLGTVTRNQGMELESVPGESMSAPWDLEGIDTLDLPGRGKACLWHSKSGEYLLIAGIEPTSSTSWRAGDPLGIIRGPTVYLEWRKGFMAVDPTILLAPSLFRLDAKPWRLQMEGVGSDSLKKYLLSEITKVLDLTGPRLGSLSNQGRIFSATIDQDSLRVSIKSNSHDSWELRADLRDADWGWKLLESGRANSRP